jgi:hypothetical protein
MFEGICDSRSDININYVYTVICGAQNRYSTNGNRIKQSPWNHENYSSSFILARLDIFQTWPDISFLYCVLMTNHIAEYVMFVAMNE